MMDGSSIETPPAALGYVFISWFSTRTDSARDFWCSESTGDQARTTLKKTACGCCGRSSPSARDRKVRQVRDLSCGDTRIFLELEVRRLDCRYCGKVKRERLDFLADNPLYTKRFAHFVGRRCRQATIKDVAKELALDWHTVKALEMQYMEAQLARAGTPGPEVIGIDEIAIRKGHTYRIVVSDLVRGRPIWFGGEDRSEASMSRFYAWLGDRKSSRIRVAVMDMWKPFRLASACAASRDFVRQVPCHAPSGRGLGCGPQERVRAACRPRPALHQGSEIHLAVAQGEPHAKRQEGVEDIAGGQQAAQHGLCPQRELWPAVELRTRRLGPAVLRELARKPQVAAAHAV